MAKVRIVEIPPGQAPEEVRRQWVGVEIPLVDETSLPGVGVLDGHLMPRGREGYVVWVEDAIASLEKKNNESPGEGTQYAIRWWRMWQHDNPAGGNPFANTAQFIFARSVCELVLD